MSTSTLLYTNQKKTNTLLLDVQSQFSMKTSRNTTIKNNCGTVFAYRKGMRTKSICNKLNKLISEKKDGFIDNINAIINELYQKGGALYWDRQIYIDCNSDDERMRSLVTRTDKVEFEPSDDPTEHPGVVVRYKKDRVSKLYIVEVPETGTVSAVDDQTLVQLFNCEKQDFYKNLDMVVMKYANANSTIELKFLVGLWQLEKIYEERGVPFVINEDKK